VNQTLRPCSKYRAARYHCASRHHENAPIVRDMMYGSRGSASAKADGARIYKSPPLTYSTTWQLPSVAAPEIARAMAPTPSVELLAEPVEPSCAPGTIAHRLRMDYESTLREADVWKPKRLPSLHGMLSLLDRPNGRHTAASPNKTMYNTACNLNVRYGTARGGE
jgi:hypothetical protein